MKKNETLKTLYVKLCATAVFRGVLESELFKAFFACMQAERREEKLRFYARFVSEIYALGDASIARAIKKLVFEDENVYVRGVAAKKDLSEPVLAAAKKELTAFSAFCAVAPADFALEIGIDEGILPSFIGEEVALASEYEKRLSELEKYGYGIFSSSPAFRISNDGKIERIESVDSTETNSFIGYEDERERVIENTVAFLEGRPAANTLLCGDAGTGKSSTVKAVVNDFFSRGLRLIELRKDQLGCIPEVMGRIRGNPLKFIIFIDDLSFNRNDDNFSMLKAALEGSAAAKASNAVIYATSNRRHIIKENFADREGDDVHRNDTLQETLSLSDRFGLVVYYGKPDKKTYLEIVRGLAARNGVSKDVATLELEAEAFALQRGGRSARCARQFVDSLS